MARLFARHSPSEGKPFILSHWIQLDKANGFLPEWRARHCITGRQVFFSIQSTQEKIMARKQKNQPLISKPTKKIADARRVRYGAGMAPACLALARNDDAATRDSRRVRFGGGVISAALKKQ